ncbi:mast cell protease 1A-like [Lutra lutra]|uniref:mast cell protease 1A-like n=1 Tax=Lutra lutra TaxID=9657 RepID=UPI001FD1AAA8|nr:mast cell protease 1A-like [Lutra lutra]
MSTNHWAWTAIGGTQTEPYVIKTTTPERNTVVRGLGGSTAAPTWAAFLGKCSCSYSLWPFFWLPRLRQIQNPNKSCGGFLGHENFVLTVVHCKGSSIRVILGTHNIKEQERTQQVIPVRKAIHHSDYNPKYVFNNIMLLQGDSGGPLVCNMAQGIVSFRKTDGEPPHVYTRISSFLHWIERTMRCFSLQGPD